MLAENVAYATVTIAAGDRVICRRNDTTVDVDNGTRGTVRATHPDRVVIETDAGTIRDLPAGYVAEHVELAYCLTGHGMQGGTVEHASVLADVRDLTKGWSYTALCARARRDTAAHRRKRHEGRDRAASSAAPTIASRPTARRSSPARERRC